MGEDVKKNFNVAGATSEQLARKFYTGLERTFFDSTESGYQSAAHKAEALASIGRYIDENGPACHIGLRNREFLKTKIAELAEKKNEQVGMENGEPVYNTEVTEGVFTRNGLFTQSDLEDALIGMADRLGQKSISEESWRAAGRIVLIDSEEDFEEARKEDLDVRETVTIPLPPIPGKSTPSSITLPTPNGKGISVTIPGTGIQLPPVTVPVGDPFISAMAKFVDHITEAREHAYIKVVKPEALAETFYKGLLKINNETTDPESKMKALHEFIDAHGGECFLDRNRREDLKSRLAGFADENGRRFEREKFIVEDNVRSAFQGMTENLDRKNIRDDSWRAAYRMIGIPALQALREDIAYNPTRSNTWFGVGSPTLPIEPSASQYEKSGSPMSEIDQKNPEVRAMATFIDHIIDAQLHARNLEARPAVPKAAVPQN